MDKNSILSELKNKLNPRVIYSFVDDILRVSFYKPNTYISYQYKVHDHKLFYIGYQRLIGLNVINCLQLNIETNLTDIINNCNRYFD
jgi:hypothetical protein